MLHIDSLIYYFSSLCFLQNDSFNGHRFFFHFSYSCWFSQSLYPGNLCLYIHTTFFLHSASPSASTIEVVHFCKSLLNLYQTAKCHILEDSIIWVYLFIYSTLETEDVTVISYLKRLIISSQVNLSVVWGIEMLHVAGLQGMCVFPVLCEMNGGAAFLVCTVILYLVLGIPVVLVESGLGQLSRQSPAALFPKLCPLLSGM